MISTADMNQRASLPATSQGSIGSRKAASLSNSEWDPRRTAYMETLNRLCSQSGDEDLGAEFTALQQTLGRVLKCKSSIICVGQCICDPTRTTGISDFEHDFDLLAQKVCERKDLIGRSTNFTSSKTPADDLADLQRVLSTNGEILSWRELYGLC
jgi:hypothetical protein